MPRKIKDVLWQVIQCAKMERQSFIDAYHNDNFLKEVKEALADIKSFEMLQKRLFGTTQSEMDVMLSKMKEVNLFSTEGLKSVFDEVLNERKEYDTK